MAAGGAGGSGGATLGGDFRLGDRTVQRMGYGAMRLTGKGIWGEPADREAAKAVLRRAVELGITLIDTSDAYGPDVNERLIAEALAPYGEVTVATKGGLLRDGPGQWRPDGRPEHLKEACEGSLRRLEVDAIELYQLHSPDTKVPFEDSVGALADLQAEGKVRSIGLSNVSVAQLARAREIVQVVSVQNRYNLSDRASEDVVEACEADGIGFLPWYPVAAGDLAKPGGALDTVASRHDATTAQVALAWLLHRSPVMLPIPGTSTIAHLEENAASVELRLSDEDLATLAS